MYRAALSTTGLCLYGVSGTTEAGVAAGRTMACGRRPTRRGTGWLRLD